MQRDAIMKKHLINDIIYNSLIFMSNKCHAACQNFAKTIRNMVVGAVMSTMTALNGAHAQEEDKTAPDRGTYMQNLNVAPHQDNAALRKPEKPCVPSPVLKITPQGTITKMEIPPDCPGKYLEAKNKC